MRFMKASMLFLIAILLFSSCEKSELIDLPKEDEVKPYEQQSFEGALAQVLPNDECFMFSYPIRYEMPDGSILILDDANDTALKDWYEDNINSETRPALIYPVQVILDVELIPVFNDEELSRIKDICEDKWEYRKDCFEFIFPISFTMPDGSIISLQDEEDSALKDYYDANPDEEERPRINFPVDINYKDEIITIDTHDGLDRVKDACDDYNGESATDLCFNFVFPISVAMDNTILTADSIEELRSVIGDWYENNPGQEVKPELQYPLEIIYEDGLIQLINNEEELIDAKKDC